MILLFKRRKRLMLSYIIYFFAVWFIPLAIIIYGIYKKSKKFWLTGICLIPIFLIVMPVIAMFFGGDNM